MTMRYAHLAQGIGDEMLGNLTINLTRRDPRALGFTRIRGLCMVR